MTPTMVLKDGKVVLLTGSPGGRTIINTVFTIVLGVVEYGLNGRQAVDLARMHHQWLPDRVTVEKENGPSEEVLGEAQGDGPRRHRRRAPGRRAFDLGRAGRDASTASTKSARRTARRRCRS